MKNSKTPGLNKRIVQPVHKKYFCNHFICEGLQSCLGWQTCKCFIALRETGLKICQNDKAGWGCWCSVQTKRCEAAFGVLPFEQIFCPHIKHMSHTTITVRICESPAQPHWLTGNRQCNSHTIFTKKKALERCTITSNRQRYMLNKMLHK